MKYSFSHHSSFRKHSGKGLYMAFEGVDGSGKSTQVEKVAEFLENRGKKVTITSEPMAEGPIQQVIRDVLFSKVKIPSRAYQALYSADRAVNHAAIIEPALEKGGVVLTHRSNWSTIPHGVVDIGDEDDFEAKGWPIAVAQGLLSGFHEFIMPDHTFYLRVSAKTAAERLSGMSKTKDSYEKIEKLRKIVNGYEYEIEKFPEEFIVIDGEQDEEKVTHEIVAKLMKIM